MLIELPLVRQTMSVDGVGEEDDAAEEAGELEQEVAVES